MDWTIAGIGIGLAINLALWAYSYGKLTQRVDDLESQMNKGELAVTANRNGFEKRLSDEAHVMLPECGVTFQKLGSDIANLSGKMDMVIMLLKPKA